MLFHIPDHNNEVTKNDVTPTESKAHADGSYEVVFDSKNTDTEYSDEGFNAYGFSANGARKTSENEETSIATIKRNNRTAAIVLIVSALLTVFSVTLSITSFFMLKNNTPEIVIGSKPTPPDTLEPWTNPYDSLPTDAYAAATAKTINSVVVIDVTLKNTTGSGSGIIWALGND